MTPRWLIRAGWTGWQQELGWALIALSVVMPCLAFSFYSSAMLPFQDPTPEMLAQQAKDVHQTEVLLLIAGAVGLSTLLVGVWLIVRGRRHAHRAG
ncbi:hypothetical protein ACNTMW_09475 [Planosporangium sp. 12N6]|uniref:hypothetical protein n=1 Tax=Planosporangium spinosum TaxID=3402278 RepID=UPI003CE979BA